MYLNRYNTNLVKKDIYKPIIKRHQSMDNIKKPPLASPPPPPKPNTPAHPHPSQTQVSSSTQSSKISNVQYHMICSTRRSLGVVQAYGICTTQGIVKKVNEDGVSVILDVAVGPSVSKSSYFSLFDGHGGGGCMRFLRDNLHKMIVDDPHFATRVEKSIYNGIMNAERAFLSGAARSQEVDRSGACAIVCVYRGRIMSRETTRATSETWETAGPS